MKEQDQRAVESMCATGMTLDTLCTCFPDCSKEEIKEVYDKFHSSSEQKEADISISVNCS